MVAQTRANYKQRCQIQALRYTARWPIRQIATALSVKKTTVARICDTPATPKKRRSTHNIAFSTPARKKLVEFVTSSAITRRMTYEEIAAATDLQCSSRAIGRALFKEGYGRRIARKKPW
jgi:O6-methylguanine-DNA--protein-cysteine methyltransferase